MGPEFKPPANEEEFQARAKTISTEGAMAMIKALSARRAAAVRPFNIEIEFYERVLKEREAKS